MLRGVGGESHARSGRQAGGHPDNHRSEIGFRSDETGTFSPRPFRGWRNCGRQSLAGFRAGLVARPVPHVLQLLPPTAEPGGTTTDPVHSWSCLCRALSIASVRRNGHRGKWRAPGGPTVPARCCCCCGAVGRPRPAGARQGRGRRQRPSLSAPTASDARLDRSYTNSSESRASSSDDPFFFPLRSQSETQRQQRKRLRTHGMSLIDRGRRIYSPARRRLHAIHANKYYHS